MRREPKSKRDWEETVYRNRDFRGNTMALNSSLSVVTLNVNGVNAPIKRHRVGHLGGSVS